MAEHNQIVENWLSERRNECFPEVSDREWQASQYQRFMRSLGTEVVKLPNIDLEHLEYSELWQATSVVDSIHTAAIGFGEGKSLAIWSHGDVNLQSVKNRNQKFVNKEYLELAADEYLNLPVRSKIIDRCLVDMLIFCEFSEFTNTVHRGFFGVGRRSGNGPVGWILGRCLSALLFCGPALVIGWLFQTNWAMWVAVVLVSLFFLESLWALLVFPFAWRGQITHNAKLSEILQVMNGVYRELDTHGQISAGHIREIAQAATLKGVVWPSVLFVLLDDVIGRDGRL